MKIAKDSDSVEFHGHGVLVSPGFRDGTEIMAKRTCVACDAPLDAEAIQVKIGGKSVEVCCTDCAQTLTEADASTRERKD